MRALPALPDPLVPPPGWPVAKVRWDRHAPLWRAVLRFAAGKATRPRFCKLPPEHWGGRGLAEDMRRMNRAIKRGHWVDAECEGTRNRFAALVETLPARVAGGAG